MIQRRSRRDAIKMSLTALVGVPAITALNACTQCSKPADTTSAPASAPNTETSNAAPASNAADTAAAPASTPATSGGETLTLISETDPTATALSYKHNAAEVPTAQQTEKSGVPFSGQNCASCSFYKAAGQLDGAEVGSCQLFPNGKVKSTGWCVSWAKPS